MIIKEDDLYYLDTGDEEKKYLLVHFVEQIDPNNFFVRVKLINNKDDLNDFKKLDESEYVKIGFMWYEDRLLPFDGNKDIKKIIEERSKITYYPNEYGMLFQYTGKLDYNKKLFDKMIFLGNFKMKSPKDEYIPWDIYNYTLLQSYCFIEKILERYELYNLKKSEAFDKEFSNKQRMIVALANKYLEK